MPEIGETIVTPHGAGSGDREKKKAVLPCPLKALGLLMYHFKMLKIRPSIWGRQQVSQNITCVRWETGVG
jgi:hypothetical protein